MEYPFQKLITFAIIDLDEDQIIVWIADNPQIIFDVCKIDIIIMLINIDSCAYFSLGL